MSLRQNLFDAAHSVADVWELIAATEHAARDFMAAQQGVRHTRSASRLISGASLTGCSAPASCGRMERNACRT